MNQMPEQFGGEVVMDAVAPAPGNAMATPRSSTYRFDAQAVALHAVAEEEWWPQGLQLVDLAADADAYALACCEAREDAEGGWDAFNATTFGDLDWLSDCSPLAQPFLPVVPAHGLSAKADGGATSDRPLQHHRPYRWWRCRGCIDENRAYAASLLPWEARVSSACDAQLEDLRAQRARTADQERQQAERDAKLQRREAFQQQRRAARATTVQARQEEGARQAAIRVADGVARAAECRATLALQDRLLRRSLALRSVSPVSEADMATAPRGHAASLRRRELEQSSTNRRAARACECPSSSRPRRSGGCTGSPSGMVVRFLALVALLRPAASPKEAVVDEPVRLDGTSARSRVRHARARLIGSRRAPPRRETPGCGLNRHPSRKSPGVVHEATVRATATV